MVKPFFFFPKDFQDIFIFIYSDFFSNPILHSVPLLLLYQKLQLAKIPETIQVAETLHLPFFFSF